MIEIAVLKYCGGCQTEKVTGDFNRASIKPDGLQTQCRECQSSLKRSWYAANRSRLLGAMSKQWLAKTLNRIGVPESKYVEVLDAQNGLCAVCMQPDVDGARLSIDHDHRNGDFRGLLCRRCNLGLAYFNDVPDRLMAASAYLNRPTART